MAGLTKAQRAAKAKLPVAEKATVPEELKFKMEFFQNDVANITVPGYKAMGVHIAVARALDFLQKRVAALEKRS